MTKLSLETYWTVPRVSSLALSPDGRRLVLGVQALGPDSARFVSSLWELPADGSAPARRLTYSEKGEGAHAFLPDGSLLFASARPDVTSKEDEGDGRLFLLPAGGGEARPVLSLPAGVEDLAVAADVPVAVFRSALFDDASTFEQDAGKAKRRKETGTSGVLFEGFPARWWDHDLGPRHARLWRLDLGAAEPEPEDLTPQPGSALHEVSADVSADGATVVTSWWRDLGRTELQIELVAIGGGERRTLGSGADFSSPAISPDGRSVVSVRDLPTSPTEPDESTLWLVDLESGDGRDLLPGFDRSPLAPQWSADSGTVWFTAEERGRTPIFKVDVRTGAVTRVAAEGAYSSVRPARDGASVYALRSSFSSPNEVVRVDVATGAETALPTPGLPLELPGRVEEVAVTAADGVELHGWLVLPLDAAPGRPAPLLLWIHGGPLSSWSAWSWRWCAHLMAERGYAVLMPDPALSLGYGREFVRRGWNRWGEPTWRDLETVLDAVLARPDLDETRTAAMGASFGGYMANWLAGHTDRFRCIVTHAGVWSLDSFVDTTDAPHWWVQQFGDPDAASAHYEEISPRVARHEVKTPMLVIHGRQDFRVPVGEGERLYTELTRLGVPVRYLLFPDENHWVLKPGNSRLWYETVLAFLDEHVLGAGWNRPELV